MSNLFNLLAKVKKSEPTTGINPGLKQAVANNKNSPRFRDKNMQYILLGLIALLLGGALLYYIEFMRPPKMVMNRRPDQPTVTQPQPPEPSAAVQGAVSSASVAAAIQLPRSSAVKPSTPPAAKNSQKRVVRTPQQAKSKPAPAKPTGRAIAVPPPAPSVSPQTAAPLRTLPDSASRDALLLAARETELRRDFRQSLLLYRKALELDQENYRIHNNIAGINIQTGNYSDAAAAAQSALKIRGDYIPALVNAGIAMARSGKDTEAAAEFAKVLAMDPSHRGALFNLALLREKSGAFEEAASLAKKLVESGDIQGLISLGRIYEKQHKLQSARQAYRDALAFPGGAASVKVAAKERLQNLE